MSFLAPVFLIGALGVALPIIAHILNNNKFQDTDWAAMQFLDNSIRIKSKEIKVKDILLLILRLLAVILLVLAISKPFIKNAEGLASQLGEKRVGTIIALDASFSMQHKDGKQTRFAKAKQKVEEIVSTINPGNPITFALLGAEHQVLLQNRTYEAESFSQLLNSQSASPEALDIDSIPRRLKDLVNEIDAPQKEIYIISDIQEQDWKTGADRLKHALKDLSKSATLYMIPVLGEQDNLAITNFELVSGVLRKGTTARYSATVHNHGSSAVQNVKISGLLNNLTVDSKTIPNIAAGSAKTISLFIPFQNPGPAKIAAKIKSDSLELDNIRRTVAIIRNKVSVLCVEKSSKKASQFRGFITSALISREGGTTEKDFTVKSIPWVSLPAQDLNNFDVVILADVPTITKDQTKRFDQFVRNGNGLIWFPGEETKLKAWNEHSKQEGTPFLPAVIEQTVSAADALGIGRPLSPNIPEHTVANPLLSLSEDLLSEARFLKLLQVNPNPTSTTILTLAGSNAPLLLEHAHGRGQVFMFTSSAEPGWNTMTISPIFPMLLQQMVTYLTAREFEKPRMVGSSLSLSYVSEPDSSDAVFDTPAGETITVPVVEYNNHYRAMLGHAKEVGYYLARGSLQSPGIPIAVNVDTKESNVKCLVEKEFEKVFADTGIQIIQSNEELIESHDNSRSITSFWRLFATICIIIMLIESLLACRLPKAKISPSASTTTGSEA